MPPGFPTCSCKKLEKIIEKYCGKPIRQNGSHRVYKSPLNGKKFTFPTRSKDFKTAIVRKILVRDLGLSEEQAIKEVRKG
ncbi:type II toxin-antitoxin system HicA family toxin [Corynebacterium amycolatum]|uniref:type II toxin-antitoxin system HicA family toxin n=1 Tax=Corynebacterium amycolatum TaxID=43765 RepID=UPI00254ED27E|nr:type II toxin-antitoxin system HicA family toxin [Corynebacterium amycolatum]MDK8726764.1 type II toxin-antitoxin system HicA family toxin [Corynebacterium amycolatum]